MEWILVLVIVMDGNRLVSNTVPGFRSLKACERTLEEAKKRAQDHFGMSPEASREAFRRSFCIEKIAQ